MVKRFIMVTLALLTIGVQAFAQNVVTGKVTDANGEPVVGAGVQVKGTTTGVVTDLDGNFSIKTGEGAVLVVSSIGYKTASVAAGSRAKINVVLEEDALFLDDVVVTGYNTQTRKKDLTGSITQISNKIIENQNTSSVSKILEGAVAGLNIASIDGQPGVDAGIRIRGVGSTQVNSSGALIVLDGVPVDPAISNPLSQINTQDIQSVTVLKDAASAAIYGSKGANGVVLITTKSGHSGKTKISFSSKIGQLTPRLIIMSMFGRVSTTHTATAILSRALTVSTPLTSIPRSLMTRRLSLLASTSSTTQVEPIMIPSARTLSATTWPIMFPERFT